MDHLHLSSTTPPAPMASSPPPPPPPPPSYWCYQCTRLITAIPSSNDVVCPHCRGGFIHLVDPTDHFPHHLPPPRSNARRGNRSSTLSLFNPLVVLRSDPAQPGYDLFYDDGSGSGLRPLPPSISDALLGSGFELMLDRLSQIGFSLWSRPENPPASKRAVASLPSVQIEDCHVESDARCAICTDAFAVGSEAREMPCKHIYHSDCIFPWLDLHSSCPVCRHELPSDGDGDETGGSGSGRAGLTIWRLPGGGFAVGRFVGGGGRREAMPSVYSEVDGGFGVSREIEWGPLVRRRRSGVRRFFGSLGSIFRRGSGSGHSHGLIRRSTSISVTSLSGQGQGGQSFLGRLMSRRADRDTHVAVVEQ